MFGRSPGISRVGQSGEQRQYGCMFEFQTHYSFVVVPLSGGNFWKSQYDASGGQSSWTTMNTTPPLLTNHGLSESEVARFHGQDGRGSYTSLKYRPSTGGWFLWGALACDPNQSGISNWDAIKTSNSSWYTRAGAPPPGDC